MNYKQLINTYGFYQDKHWTKVAIYIRNKYNHICQKCGKRGNYVHHKNPLTQDDYINRPLAKCYGEDNLTLLCHNCHELEHTKKRNRDGTYFDDTGQIRLVEENTNDK